MATTHRQPPIIVAFVSDLLFTTRVEDAARRLNYQVKLIERFEQVASPEEQEPQKKQLAEHLVGSGAILLETLTHWQPVLLIFDLDNEAIPWRDWIALIKSVPATRRMPLICFGSHVDVESLKEAKERGADATLARSLFFSTLPEIIQKYARIPDYAAVEEACTEELSPKARRGLEEFNRGEYFEAHETLEEAWNEDEAPGRELYRAILQVAVAYLQIERGNYNGAVKMFLRMRQWFAPLPDECRGVDVRGLRSDSQMVYEALVALGRERIGEFDRSLLRPVIYHPV